MASKSKKQSKGRLTINLLDRVKRNLERGDFKQALKDVRVCYRQNPASDCRCFLEHAYIGRAQQLARKGLIEDSRRIVRDLLELGVTEPAVKGELPDLLLSVGMLDSLPRTDVALTNADQDRLRVKAADQAVANPLNTPKSMPEVREDAQRIRAALEAVERGDESVALEFLKDIPRQSLFADWKYFVRGLMAYYRRDGVGMTDNWDRLDADRAAARIVTPLKVVAGMAPPKDDGNLRWKVGRLENQAADRMVLTKLIRIRQFAADHDWPLLFKTLQTSRRALREMDEGVYGRLVSYLCGIFMREGLVEEMEQFSRIVDPPAIDPGWNRAKAIACEFSEYRDDDPQEHWREYLRDLKNLPMFTLEQRDLARGLVWLRLAEHYVEDAVGLRGCRCGFAHGPEIEEAEEQAEYAFEQCFKLAPAHAPAYVAAAMFHASANRPEEAAKIYLRLLDRTPDHLDALIFLAKHHVSRGKSLEAREFALHAHELKPLDNDARELLWTVRIEAARDLARTGQCDKARDEAAAADRLQPARAEDFDVLARKAALELKAGNTDAARRFVEQAQEQLDKSTVLWLVMAIEAVRHDLPWQEVHLYEKRWLQDLKRRCHGETAGLMCNLLAEHTRILQPYSGHDKHTLNLLQYIERCSRVKWRPQDLRSVCEFLEHREELVLLAKFAKKGIQKHPQVGYFHWLIGMVEFRMGPFHCNRPVAITQLKMAIELASKSGDPRDDRIVKNAKQCLGMIEDTSRYHDEYCDDDSDDDLDDEMDDYYEDEYDGPMNGLTIAALRDLVDKVCKKLGMDAEEMFNQITGGQAGKANHK